MRRNYLYTYFGNLIPNKADIPGHFLYQPFLIEEICQRLNPQDQEYSVDIYSLTSNIDPELQIGEKVDFPHYLPSVSNIVGEFSKSHLGTVNPEVPYIAFGDVIRRIRDDYYSGLILKARFRNTSTHSKRLYDVRKFESICFTGICHKIPILIVDTDLALSSDFIEEIINPNENIKIIGLGDISKAYPNLDKSKILSNVPLYGISLNTLVKIYRVFESNPEEIINSKSKDKTLLYYGNVAASNYKEGHTKNYEILEYLIKLSEEKFFHKMNGYIIGKVEDKRFISGFKHVKRYERDRICGLHKEARLSVNISKVLYEKTDFNPARLSESWVYGVLPLTYSSDGNYQNNRGLVFKNYFEFLECIRLYLIDTGPEDYYKMFMNCLKNCIDDRKEKECDRV